MNSASSWILRRISRLVQAARLPPRSSLIRAATFAAAGACVAGAVCGLGWKRLHTPIYAAASEPAKKTAAAAIRPQTTVTTIHIRYDSRNRLQKADALAREMSLHTFLSLVLGGSDNLVIQLVDTAANSDKVSAAESARAYLETPMGSVRLPKDASQVPGFIRRKSGVVSAENVYEAAEFLKESNHGLFDSSVVFYCSDGKWAKYLADPERRKTVECLLRLHSGVLRVPSKKLARKLGLKKGRFYRYYKPSFVNGYANVYGMNAEYWQLVEAECRDELTPVGQEIQKTSAKTFDNETAGKSLFRCSEDVEFHFCKSYRKLAEQPRNGRPIVYIYWDKNAIIWPFMDNLTKFARKYDCECDFVFSSDLRKSSRWFNMGDVEENLPYVIIVDPDKKIPVKNPITQQSQGEYRALYSDIVLLMLGVDEGSKFIEKYFKGELTHMPQSKRMSRPSLVKRINKDTFESDVLNNDAVEQCVIQIYKHNCASCYYNSKSFDALSWKLKKYGLDDKLKLYKMYNDNDVPQLGTFPFTPMYIYIRKGKDDAKNQIVELATLESMQKFDQFKSQLEKLSGLDLSRIVVDPKAQFDKYIKREDKVEGFDFDFDASAPPMQVETKKDDTGKSQTESEVKSEIPAAAAAPASKETVEEKPKEIVKSEEKKPQ